MRKEERFQEASEKLLEMFETGHMPEAVAFSIIRRKKGDHIPSMDWSIGNQILMMCNGTTDARGFKQWKTVGRTVKKGSKAIYILAPLVKKIKEDDPEEEKIIVMGFRPIPVFPIEDTEWMARIAARRSGVGCEGIILIQPSDQADFRMRFINPDGGEVDMCGNGARCVARLAADLGAAPANMSIQTQAGLLRARVDGDQVQLDMTAPRDWAMDVTLDADGPAPIIGHAVNTGVEHFVVETPDLDAADVQAEGARVRYHKAFAPRGTNANFIRVENGNRLRVRTYERGVEAETLACGTGIVASGLVAARLGRVTLPVTVIPTGGDELEVDGQINDTGATNVTLKGPAVYVYRGTLTHIAD